jgi:hypothetical protein
MHFLDHLLATCAAHIDIVEEKDGSFGSTSMRSFSGFGSTSLDTPIKGVGYTTPNAPPVSVPSTLSATQIEDQVYQFLLSGKSTEWGFSKSDCVLKFKGTVSENDINKAVETLLDDARIYDTGDEMHFKAIE